MHARHRLGMISTIQCVISSSLVSDLFLLLSFFPAELLQIVSMLGSVAYQATYTKTSQMRLVGGILGDLAGHGSALTSC